MASWQDGAEYAPIERPDGFATPRVAVLSQAPPTINPAAHQPIEPPHVFEQRHPAVPLEALVPATGPTRDPGQAFTSTSAMSSGAWGAAHADGVHAAAAWNPETPLITSAARESSAAIPLGPPSGRPLGAATQFAPPQGAPVAPGAMPGFPPPAGPPSSSRGPQGLSLAVPPGAGMPRQLLALLGWPTLLLLTLGSFYGPVSFGVLLLAGFLVMRAKVVGTRLFRITLLLFTASLVLGILFPSGTDGLDTFNRWAQPACVVALLVNLFVGYRTLNSHR